MKTTIDTIREALELAKSELGYHIAGIDASAKTWEALESISMALAILSTEPAQDDGKPESETTNRLLECSVCSDLEGAPYEQGDTCTMCGVGVYRTKPTPSRDIPGEVWDMLVDHLPAKGRTKLYDKMRAYFGAVTGKEPVRGDVQP